MSHRLLVNPGTPQAWEISLKPGVNRIGRGEQNDFTINHGSVSTHHCEVTVTDAAVILKDLGSTNGTFVERAPVTEIQLRPGQHVQFGAVDMVFESSAFTAQPVAAGIPAPPPPPPPVGGLRINRGSESHSPAPAPMQPLAAISAPAPPASFRNVPGFKSADSEPDDGPKRNFALSLTGVFLGAFLGLLIWHLIYRYTGWNIKLMAIGIGCLAGVAPQLLGHYRGKLMGFLAAVVALGAIFTTQYLNARLQFDEFAGEIQTDFYAEQLAYAKRAITAIPNETDEEIRNFLAKEFSIEEYRVKPEDIETEDITDLKTELPKLRDLASGKITKEEFNKDFIAGQEELEESGALGIYFLIRTLGLFNIVNIVLGVGAAYMTAKGDR